MGDGIKKKLVLVVHGIGEQKAGETLDALVGATTGNSSYRVQSDQRWLRENHADSNPRAIDHFHSHTRTVTTPNAVIEFAEVFWADLSRGPAGKLSTLYELVTVVLDLGHLVRESAAEIHPDGHLLRTMANGFVAILHGPVTVLTLLIATAALLLHAAHQLFGELILNQDCSAPSDITLHIIVILVGLLAVMISLYTQYQTGKKRHAKDRKQPANKLLSIFLNWLRALGAAIIVLAFVTMVFNLNEKDWLTIGPHEHRNLAITWYGFIFTIPILVMWLILLVSACFVYAYQSVLNIIADDRSSHPLFHTVCCAMVVLWMMIASTFWATLLKVMDPVIISETVKDMATRMIFITWLNVILVVATIIVVWFSHSGIAKKYYTPEPPSEPEPRVILNRYITFAFAFAVALFTSIAILFNLASVTELPSALLRFLEFIRSTNFIGYVLALSAGVVYLTFWARVATGLGVIKDVITYFNGNPDNRKSQAPEFPFRTRMRKRLLTVLETMIKVTRPEEVVIISHSQGTVIAVDAIKSDDISGTLKAHGLPQKCSLITMGSPVDHIYHHYFSRDFPIPQGFDQKLHKWINIYRVDDFVGTWIKSGDDHWPYNRAVEAGGHTGYWEDDQVLKILKAEVLPELAVSGSVNSA